MFTKRSTTAHKGERWSGIAKQLIDYLENFRKQQEFLREIDRRIISSQGGDIRELLQFVVDRTSMLLPVTNASFYSIDGDDAVLLASAGRPAELAGRVALEDIRRCFQEHEEGTGIWVADGAKDCLFGFRGAAVVAARVWRDQDDLGLLLVETDQDSASRSSPNPNAAAFSPPSPGRPPWP